MNFESQFEVFHRRNYIRNVVCQNGGHFVSASIWKQTWMLAFSIIFWYLDGAGSLIQFTEGPHFAAFYKCISLDEKKPLYFKQNYHAMNSHALRWFFVKIVSPRETRTRYFCVIKTKDVGAMATLGTAVSTAGEWFTTLDELPNSLFVTSCFRGYK